MSIKEASRLVIKSATIPKGNIFILDMGNPIKISELAKKLIKLYSRDDKQIPIIYTGLRKGEKLHEELLSNKERLKTLFLDTSYVLTYNYKLKWKVLL